MYAHKDIAFEVASAISPVFKIYLIREFQRLKEQENDQNKTEWNLQQTVGAKNKLAERMRPVVCWNECGMQKTILILALLLIWVIIIGLRMKRKAREARTNLFLSACGNN